MGPLFMLNTLYNSGVCSLWLTSFLSAHQKFINSNEYFSIWVFIHYFILHLQSQLPVQSLSLVGP